MSRLKSNGKVHSYPYSVSYELFYLLGWNILSARGLHQAEIDVLGLRSLKAGYSTQ